MISALTYIIKITLLNNLLENFNYRSLLINKLLTKVS